MTRSDPRAVDGACGHFVVARLKFADFAGSAARIQTPHELVALVADAPKTELVVLGLRDTAHSDIGGWCSSA
jgi:hypothetical protein